VPPSHGQALFEAASQPKRMQLFPRLGHNDFVTEAGRSYGEAIASWVNQLP
jgi:hypothetical protein